MRKIIKIIFLVISDALASFLYMQWYNYLTGNYWFLRNENHALKRIFMLLAIAASVIIVIVVNIMLIKSIINSKTKEEDSDASGKTEETNKKLQEISSLEDLIKIFQETGINKPKLKPLMDEAIEQIEIYQEDKNALEHVMQLQEIDYFPIKNCVMSTETKLFKLMKRLLSDIAVWNSKRIEDEDRKNSYNELYESMEKKIRSSNDLTNSFHNLLMRVRTLKDEDYDNDTEIQRLIEALDVSRS